MLRCRDGHLVSTNSGPCGLACHVGIGDHRRPAAQQRNHQSRTKVWLECYARMAALLITRFPLKGPKLWAYQTTILSAAHNYEGSNWVVPLHYIIAGKLFLYNSVQMSTILYLHVYVGQRARYSSFTTTYIDAVFKTATTYR